MTYRNESPRHTTPSASAAPHTADRANGPAIFSSLPPVAMAFCERLRHLPIGTWADAVQLSTAAPPGGVAATAAARVRLRDVMNDLPVVTTQLRRRVADLAAVAERFVRPPTVARMQKAALTAVMALVARPRLGSEEFGRLYAPFATIIPAHELLPGAPES